MKINPFSKGGDNSDYDWNLFKPYHLVNIYDVLGSNQILNWEMGPLIDGINFVISS